MTMVMTVSMTMTTVEVLKNYVAAEMVVDKTLSFIKAYMICGEFAS